MYLPRSPRMQVSGLSLNSRSYGFSMLVSSEHTMVLRLVCVFQGW
jgi:hypothetical protein